MSDDGAALGELNRQIAVCVDCELSETRTRTVPGEGRPDADIMLIGEAPGYYEDQQGRPFVGAAGQFLEQLFHATGQQHVRTMTDAEVEGGEVGAQHSVHSDQRNVHTVLFQ